MEVKIQSTNNNVRVVNLYSGHGSYATLGLAHWDKRIRDRFQFEWLYRMIDLASDFKAGLGFFCHAFGQKVLQDITLYEQKLDDLYRRLAELAEYSKKKNICSLAIEQMYTPHQVPWTIQGSIDLLRRVYKVSGSPIYLTIDTGHQSGQIKYLKPGNVQLENYINNIQHIPETQVIWLGPKINYGLVAKSSVEKEGYGEEILTNIEKYPHMFSDIRDTSPYTWLEELGCYSPIIHLQQTDGYHSSHWPFTESRNENGIIEAEKVLKSIARSYESDAEPGMPPKCKSIYLTLEIFSPTSEKPENILRNMEDSVKCWRKFIPEDGVKLNELI
jgi:hypothetical protein